MIGEGSIVIIHLKEPTEKFWGVLDRLNSVGVFVRGLNLSTFDDFMSQAASGRPLTLGLATMFFPMARIERLFLDEQVGSVESYCQRFERRVGMPVATFIGLAEEAARSAEGQKPS